MLSNINVTPAQIYRNYRLDYYFICFRSPQSTSSVAAESSWGDDAVAQLEDCPNSSLDKEPSMLLEEENCCSVLPKDIIFRQKEEEENHHQEIEKRHHTEVSYE